MEILVSRALGVSWEGHLHGQSKDFRHWKVCKVSKYSCWQPWFSFVIILKQQCTPIVWSYLLCREVCWWILFQKFAGFYRIIFLRRSEASFVFFRSLGDLIVSNFDYFKSVWHFQPFGQYSESTFLDLVLAVLDTFTPIPSNNQTISLCSTRPLVGHWAWERSIRAFLNRESKKQ